MNIWIALLGGIILGWVIEWIIDWLFWRRGIAGFYATEGQLRNELAIAQQQRSEAVDAYSALQNSLNEESASKSAIETRMSEIEVGKVVSEQQLAAAEQQLAATQQELEEALAALKIATQPKRDDLEQIDGIGRVYEQKLFDAGINTFAHLAITPVARLQEIIQPAAWQNLNFESWVEQARKCAEVVIFDTLPYRLEEINGIGPVIAKRLNEEGIMTFYDLAHTTEKRLREIVPQRGGLKYDFAAWIKEARAFVGLTTGDRPPLPLEQIKGIGPVFATRLDLAGIHTFDDLANASEDTLRDAIGSRGVQVSNLPRWIEDARDELIKVREQRLKENPPEEEDVTPTSGESA